MPLHIVWAGIIERVAYLKVWCIWGRILSLFSKMIVMRVAKRSACYYEVAAKPLLRGLDDCHFGLSCCLLAAVSNV